MHNNFSKLLKGYLFITSFFIIISVIVAIIIYLFVIKQNTYSFDLGEGHGITFSVEPSQYESIVSYSNDKVDLSYLPKVKTNYFKIKVPIKPETNLLNPSKAVINLSFGIPEKLKNLQVYDSVNNENLNLFFKPLQNLGEPQYFDIEKNISIWNSDPTSLLDYKTIVAQKLVPNTSSDIYTHDYNLTNDFSSQLSSIRTTSPFGTTFSYPLFFRGSHSGYFYIDESVLDFKIEKYDLNWYPGDDHTEVTIKKVDSTKEYTLTLSDDGISDVNKLGQKKIMSSELIEAIEPGLYSFEIVSGDSVIAQIKGNFPLFVLSNYYSIASSDLYLVGLPLEYTAQAKSLQEFYGGFSNLNFQTIHQEATPKITFNGSDKTATKANEVYNLSFGSYVQNKLGISYGDVNLSFDGYISTSQNSYFEPFSNNVNELSEGTIFGDNYFVIGNYSKSTVVDSVLSSEFEVGYKNSGNSFVLEFYAPNLTDINGTIDVKDFSIKFK